MESKDSESAALQALGEHPYANVFDDKVIDDDSVATSADTQALGREIQNLTYLLGPFSVGVREGNDL
jgi:hypothetical protein